MDEFQRRLAHAHRIGVKVNIRYDVIVVVLIELFTSNFGWMVEYIIA